MANNNNARDDTHQCEKCLPAFCCNYFAFGIDEPENRKDIRKPIVETCSRKSINLCLPKPMVHYDPYSVQFLDS